MSMSIRQIFLSGAALILYGAAAVIITYWVFDNRRLPGGDTPVAIIGAYAAAIALVAIGLVRALRRAPIVGANRAARHERNDFVVSLRVWLIAAAADGVLRDAEVEVIIVNAKRYFDMDVDEEFVRKTFTQMRKRTSGQAIDEELLSSELPLTTEGIRRTLLGAIAVSLYDGDLDADERRVIDRLAERFELEPALIDELIVDVREGMAR